MAGRVISSIVALAFLGLGSAFAYLIVRSFFRDLATHTWREAECVITSSQVKSTGGSEPLHVLNVQYRYVAFGRELESDVLRPGYAGSSDVAEAERLAARYAVGESVTCYIDPKKPESATIEKASLLNGFWVLFPLVFVGVGLLVLVLTWMPSRSGEATAAGGLRSISKQATGRFGGAGCLVGFFALFALAGGGTGLFFLLPAAQVVKARAWHAVRCTIDSSEVRSHSGDDSTTYSVSVAYRYEIAGKTYRGNRYQFLGGSSSGQEGKQQVVDRYPPGSEASCFVNPQDPYDAVLERGFTTGYLFGLIPLLFFSVGVGGMIFALRSGSAAPARAAWQPTQSLSVAPAAVGPEAGFRYAGDGAVTLDAKGGPIGRFLGTLLVAGFWNGITGAFLYQVVSGWRSGAGDGCATAFLVPFVLIGLLLLVSLPHAFLALFNPRPVLTLSRATLPLGGTVDLSWGFKGWSSRISRLVVTLEGHEEASYRQGKSSSTAKSVFAREEVAETTDPLTIASGRATISLPIDTMHSFESSHHKVVWTLKLVGTIGFWPDVGEEIVVPVTPPGGAR